LKEIKFSLLGKDYSVRPEFRKVAAIENATGKGTIQLFHEIADSKFKTTDLVQVLSCMIGDNKVTINKIGDEVSGKVREYVGPVVEFLVACNFGSDELATEEAADASAEKND